MIPVKNMCPQCGSDEISMTGKFGNGDALLCNECGCTDFVSEPSADDEDELMDMPVKKSKLLAVEDDEVPMGEGNLIKASRAAKPTKMSKAVKASTVSKSKTKAKTSKGKKK